MSATRRILHRWDSPITGGYSSAEVNGWARGEVRAVSERLASYLLETFPECFEEQGAPPAPPAPPKRRG